MIIDGDIRASIHTCTYDGPWVFGTARYGVEARSLDRAVTALVPFEDLTHEQASLAKAVRLIRQRQATPA